MTEAELTDIRRRDREAGSTWFKGPASFTAQAARDWRELLAELDRVSAQLQQLVWNEIRRAARLGDGEGL